MIASGHWIAQRWLPPLGVDAEGGPLGTEWALTSHFESLGEAWRVVVPKKHTRVPKFEPKAIISRCPAPDTEECDDCWLAEVPF